MQKIHLKVFQEEQLQKIAEATGYLIVKKIADKIIIKSKLSMKPKQWEVPDGNPMKIIK